MAVVVGIIESLGAGGAERQFCYLMRHLALEGHTMVAITYKTFDTSDFYRDLLDSSAVDIRHLPPMTRRARVGRIANICREAGAQLIIAFMTSAMTYGTVVAKWLGVPILCSERNHDANSSLGFLARMVLLGLSDAVVANSQAQKDVMELRAPWLHGKPKLIRNAYYPPAEPPQRKNAGFGLERDCTFVTVATYSPSKNVMRAVEAFRRVSSGEMGVLSYRWFGQTLTEATAGHPERNIYLQARAYAERHRLTDRLALNGPTREPLHEMSRARFFVLPSLQEGFPNALIEACFAGAVPIVSAISDLPLLVKEGETGFLFDPAKVESVAAAMKRALALSDQQRTLMADRALTAARSMFDPDIALGLWGDVVAAHLAK